MPYCRIITIKFCRAPCTVGNKAFAADRAASCVWESSDPSFTSTSIERSSNSSQEAFGTLDEKQQNERVTNKQQVNCISLLSGQISRLYIICGTRSIQRHSFVSPSCPKHNFTINFCGPFQLNLEVKSSSRLTSHHPLACIARAPSKFSNSGNDTPGASRGPSSIFKQIFQLFLSPDR